MLITGIGDSIKNKFVVLGSGSGHENCEKFILSSFAILKKLLKRTTKVQNLLSLMLERDFDLSAS